MASDARGVPLVAEPLMRSIAPNIAMRRSQMDSRERRGDGSTIAYSTTAFNTAHYRALHATLGSAGIKPAGSPKKGRSGR
jgi:hypothetical protein